MTRPAILSHLDICPHEKCETCGGMLRVPHENIITISLSADKTDDVQDGWCEGGTDDIECQCGEREADA